MTWIESRLEDLEAWNKRMAAIRDGSLEIYEAIWKEITGHLEEAKGKGFKVSTNGLPRSRAIMLEKQNLSGQSFKVEMTLVQAKDRIRAKGDRVDLSLDLDVCADGVVCIKLDGQQISIEAAAIAILDPFLFPQLQKS
jgi:hypothetical protein